MLRAVANMVGGGFAGSFTTLTVSGVSSITANSASAALTVTQTGAGNAFVVEDSASDTTPFVIRSDGATTIGSSTSDAKPLNVVGTSDTGALFRYSADTGAASLWFQKSRSASIDVQTIVQSGDRCGGLFFTGSDGAAFIRAAHIVAEVDGTPGTNDMPGRLVFSTTADGASAPTERLRIDSAGVITARIGSAIPAGGTAGFGYCATSTANFGVFFGSGAPTLSAAKGSLYLRSDGSGTNDRAYINTNGTTTWTALVTVA